MKNKNIIELVTKEQIPVAYSYFNEIVEVFFVGEIYGPITLASNDFITKDDAIQYANNIGMTAENYRIIYVKTKGQEN